MMRLGLTFACRFSMTSGCLYKNCGQYSGKPWASSRLALHLSGTDHSMMQVNVLERIAQLKVSFVHGCMNT